MDYKKEIGAGISTFLASMYIVVVNPTILSGTGVSFNAVLTSTVIVSFCGSVAMGLFARSPYLVAPGMGMNAYFAFYMVKTVGLSYSEALGAVFWASCIFVLLSFFRVREKIIDAIPNSIRHAVSAGIGLFIAFIGFQNAGIIVDNPSTLVGMAPFSETKSMIFWTGLVFTAALILYQVKGALIWGIIATSFLAFMVDKVMGTHFIHFTSFVSKPDFSLIAQIDFTGSLKWSFIPILLALVFTGLFDGLATLMSLEALNTHKDDLRLKRSLKVDSLSSVFSSWMGLSPATVYIESSVGISQGGRFGLSAIVAGLLFLPLMFLSGLLQTVPAVASNISLILVGAYMIPNITKIDWHNFEEYLPAFICFCVLPFSFSIAHGLGFGMITYLVLKVINGKIKSINIWQWLLVIFAGLALYFS